MHKFVTKFILTAFFICGIISAAWADGWKLTSTTVYGNGGYWENGQKTRIDCSYKNGTFRYERKTSKGTKMQVFSTKAEFSEPKQTYAAGEDISVRIAFTEKGERQGYTPYARVTILPQKPQWNNASNKPSNQIPAKGSVDGQALDAGGRNAVTPPETVTFMANALTNGAQMAIVYSCNGMDVVYLYDWDGDVVATPVAPMREDANAMEETEVASAEEQPQNNEVTESEQVEEETTVEERKPFEEETPNTEETTYEPLTYDESDLDDYRDYDSYNHSFPLTKLLIVIGVSALLIGLILFVFRKKKDKTPGEAAASAPKRPQPQQLQRVCPHCGTPLDEGSRFCQECGHRLNQ